MRYLQGLLYSLIAILALGCFLAATALAVEPGILFLAGDTPPVTESGEAKSGPVLRTPSGAIECSGGKGSSTGGTKSETHVDLLEEELTNTGCKMVKTACSSEDSEGKKDPKETILLVRAFTDVHWVALLNGTTLVPGQLTILLNLGKSDLLINCGGIKVLVLGIIVSEMIEAGQPFTGDITKATRNFAEKPLPCDSADKLCKDLMEKFGAKIGESTCPLGAKFGEKFECATFAQSLPWLINPMVLIDF